MKLAALLVVAALACATEKYAGPRRDVFVEHNHRGAAFMRTSTEIRQIWITNGTPDKIFVYVDCPDGEWNHYPVAPRSSQGFAEWSGECSLLCITGQ